jgi:DNA (cytosine-5)-methyltransferase 1
MRACDLFCCSGGLSVGLKANFDVVLGIDNDPSALAVYRMHHKKGMELDLGNVERSIKVIRHTGPIQLLAGSPPCTDFSSAGRREERASHAGLTAAFARIAVGLRVPCILIENVPEMLKSHAWREASDVLIKSGYSLIVIRMNSAACGVAQIRRRVFVIGVLNCNEAALRSVQREVAGFNRTPGDVATVRGCLASPADTYWYPARNTHSPCVRSTDDDGTRARRRCRCA